MSLFQEFVSFVFGCSITRISDTFILLAYVEFADERVRIAAIAIAPIVGTTPDIHARLALLPIIRLVMFPVGVGHSTQRSVRVRRSPDERGLTTTEVDALSSCPDSCTQTE